MHARILGVLLIGNVVGCITGMESYRTGYDEGGLCDFGDSAVSCMGVAVAVGNRLVGPRRLPIALSEPAGAVDVVIFEAHPPSFKLAVVDRKNNVYVYRLVPGPKVVELEQTVQPRGRARRVWVDNGQACFDLGRKLDCFNGSAWTAVAASNVSQVSVGDYACAIDERRLPFCFSSTEKKSYQVAEAQGATLIAVSTGYACAATPAEVLCWNLAVGGSDLRRLALRDVQRLGAMSGGFWAQTRSGEVSMVPSLGWFPFVLNPGNPWRDFVVLGAADVARVKPCGLVGDGGLYCTHDLFGFPISAWGQPCRAGAIQFARMADVAHQTIYFQAADRRFGSCTEQWSGSHAEIDFNALPGTATATALVALPGAYCFVADDGVARCGPLPL